MEILAFILLILFISVVIFVNAFYRSGRKSERNRLFVMPDLGIQDHPGTFAEEMRKLIGHLEASLPESYVEQVKERVIREHKISLTEWENRWFEWKRYLVLTALLPNVPMYSHEVDEVWHEMLMFTREYEDFSRQYLKTMLHHAPNPPGTKFDPHERAWFDAVYVYLFKPTRYSGMAWGTFLRHPLSPALLNDLRRMPAAALEEKYFNRHAAANVPGAGSVIRQLVRGLKARLEEIDRHVEMHGRSIAVYRANRALHKNTNRSLWMLGGVLYLSAWHQEAFAEQYQALFRKSSSSKGSSHASPSSCSSCGGAGDWSDGGNGSGGDGSGCGSGSGCGGGGGCGGGSSS